MVTSKDDLIQLVRNRAGNAPKAIFARFSLDPNKTAKEYSVTKDKLSKADRDRINEVKDRLTFPVEEDIWS